MPLVLIDISILLNILGFGQSLFLSLSLWRNRQVKPENDYLIVLLIAISLIILNSIFRLSYYVETLDFYQDFSNSFLLLVPPSVYLFVSAKLKAERRKKPLYHYVPFLIYFSFLLINYLLLGLDNSVRETGNNIAYLFFNIQFAMYFGLSLYKLRGNVASTGPLKWIKVAVWLIIIPWIAQIVILVLEVGFKQPVSDVISLNLALAFGVTAIFLSYMHASGQSGFAQKEKYESSRIDAPDLTRNMEMIKNAIIQERLFEDQGFSLSKLADKTQLTPRIISLTINQSTDQNFVDFINSYRVEAFKQLIKEEEAKNYTMVAISERCGFKSSSTFYAAFKKQTGLTPKQYRDQLD